MKHEVVKRWIYKAEVDLRTARILLNSEDPPTESVCFHAQQAAEKLLKAYLTYLGIRIRKTHDIGILLDICAKEDKDFEKLDMEKLEQLTFYAVEIRYPDTSYIPTLEEAQNAVSVVEKLKAFILKKLKRSK